MRRVAGALLCGLLACAVAARAAPEETAPVLDEASFPRLRDEILASAAECRFESIAWRSGFWQAVTEAQETDRPILLWAMNGHPLACT